MKIRRVNFEWEVKGFKRKYYNVGLFHRARKGMVTVGVYSQANVYLNKFGVI